LFELRLTVTTFNSWFIQLNCYSPIREDGKDQKFGSQGKESTLYIDTDTIPKIKRILLIIFSEILVGND